MMQYMIRFDTISNLSKLVQTCPKLLYDEIQLNLIKYLLTCKHVLIRFQTCLNLSKHVQTCPKLQYDKIILQTCPDMS